MGCGKYSISETCGERVYATCTFYQTDLPEWSDLVEQNCVTIEETTGELYEQLTTIKDNLDTNSLGEKCLTYPTNTEGEIAQSQVNLTFEAEICNLKSLIDPSASPDTHFCQNLNYGTLIDPSDCDGQPTTWCELAQFLLNKINELQP